MAKNVLGQGDLPKFPDDLVHIDRWMCSNCGLVFDFDKNFTPGDPGWVDNDPPPEQQVDFWVDKDGEYHYQEADYKEICPRCGVDVDERPLIRVFVSPTKSFSDIMPLIEQGEGLTIEFMEKFPDQAHELAKEIAAFSTTQGGKIFIGVDDEGNMKGLEEIGAPKDKDVFQQRIRRVAEKIKPKVEIYVDFVSNKSVQIAMITIRKGSMPCYWYEDRPYIRDIDQSRHANQEEVIRLVQDWNEKHKAK